MTSTRPSSSQIDSSPERSFSPLLLIAAATIGITVVLGIGMYCLSLLQLDGRRNSMSSSTAMQEIVMPDGSRLALEAVTWGRQHSHKVNYETHSLFQSRVGMHSLRHTTREKRIVLWFSCRSASGTARDFSWWSHLSTVTTNGTEIRDRDDEAGQGLTSSYRCTQTNGRPTQELPASDRDQITAWSTVKPLRHEGDTFPVRIYDRTGSVVGTFDIPDPSPANGKYPDWKPDDVPISQNLGNGLMVTLTGFRGELVEQQHNRTDVALARSGQPAQRRQKRILSNFTITENGQTILGKWRVGSMQLRDALGNQCNHLARYRDELSDRESAWQLSCLMYRNPEEKFFDSSEKWTTGVLTLPAAGQRTAVDRKVAIAGAQMSIIATGGPGSVAHEVPYPANLGSGRISAGDMYVIDIPSQNEPNGLRRITVESELPHIVFQCSSSPPQPVVTVLKSVDQNGQPVTLDGPAGNVGSGSPRFYFLRASGDADKQEPVQSVEVTFAMNAKRYVEFSVRVPEFQKPALPRIKLRPQQQRLDEANRLITHYEAKLKQAPQNALFNNNLAWAIATAPEVLRTPERIQQALNCSESACRSEPENKSYANTQGMLLLRQGRPVQAAEQFRKGILSVYDLYGLSLSECLTGEQATAEQFYRRALELQRSQAKHTQTDLFELMEEVQTLLLGQKPQALLAEINTLMDAGKPRDALQALDQILEVQDYSAWHWYRRACLNLHLGHTENWQRCCRRLIDEFRNSDDPETLNRIGKACLLAGLSEDFQAETRRCLARADAIAPDNFRIVLSLALQDLRDSRHAEALASARRALTFEQLDPTASVPLYSVIAMSAFRLGDQETAARALKHASSIREEQFPHLSGQPMGQQWPAIIVAERIYNEAETLINAPAGDGGAQSVPGRAAGPNQAGQKKKAASN